MESFSAWRKKQEYNERISRSTPAKKVKCQASDVDVCYFLLQYLVRMAQFEPQTENQNL